MPNVASSRGINNQVIDEIHTVIVSQNGNKRRIRRSQSEPLAVDNSQTVAGIGNRIRQDTTQEMLVGSNIPELASVNRAVFSGDGETGCYVVQIALENEVFDFNIGSRYRNRRLLPYLL